MAADNPPADLAEKPLPSHVERRNGSEEKQLGDSAGLAPRMMRSQFDDLPILQTAWKFRRVFALAMVAAFSASMDGYQITLNGGIVSNEGFIKQFAPSGTTIIAGKYIAAWGGIQSAGQFFGQVFLQFATDALGRKPALLILWVVLVASIFAESFATTWEHWLVAKLFSGVGVGMLQATLPVYLAEIAPTQLKGFLINAYTLWFVIGQLMGSVALESLHETKPLDFRLAIYTQWAMVGAIGIIFFLIPETPWWLVGKGKFDKASKMLLRYHGSIEGYDVHEHLEMMNATIEEEQHIARRDKQEGLWAVFRGRNSLRLIIAAWGKITQQLVGLTVFNTYATYFFQYAGNDNPFLVTVILTCVQIMSMCVTISLADRVGRRPLTVYPYGVASLSVLCLGIVGCFDYTRSALSSLLIFFACLATFATTGASAMGYAYAAEVPQQRLRAQTAGWGLAFSNLFGILFSNCTPLMINGPLTQWGVKTGFFFGVSGTLSTIVAWFILPELTRRTPAEIDEMFEKRISLRKFDKYESTSQAE